MEITEYLLSFGFCGEKYPMISSPLICNSIEFFAAIEKGSYKTQGYKEGYFDPSIDIHSGEIS